MDPWRSKRATGRSTTFEEESTVWPHAPRRHAEGLPRIKERYWNGIIVDRGHVRTDGETLDTINFSHDLCKGKLMVESGATTSVAGLRVFEHHHEDCQQNLGSAETDSQPTGEIESGRGQHAVLFCSQLEVCRSTCSGRAFTVILS